MALNNPSTLAYPPLQVAIVDPGSGKLTQQWSMWFEQMYERIGGTTPVDPTIKTQTLVNQYPYSFYLVPAGQSINFSGVTYSAGQIIPFYQSGIGVSTIIDSFTVQNMSPSAGSLTVYVVPYNNLPSPANLVVSGLPIPGGGAPVAVTQLVNTELGAGGYVVALASPSQKLLCTMKGRVLT